MNQILRSIDLDINNFDSFTTYISNVHTCNQPSIIFYNYEIISYKGHLKLDPPLHIIADVDVNLFKRVLVNDSYVINIIYSVAL